jgi:hypothetical protein
VFFILTENFGKFWEFFWKLKIYSSLNYTNFAIFKGEIRQFFLYYKMKRINNSDSLSSFYFLPFQVTGLSLKNFYLVPTTIGNFIYLPLR